MAEIGYASLGIIPTFDKFGSQLESGTSKYMSAAGSSSGSKFGSAAGKSAGSKFSGAFKKVAGALTAGYAAMKVKDFLGDSIAEARESQKVGALTTQVIKSTGGAAKVTAKHIGDLSTAISLKTGIDDEAIQSGANMLLTFKNIRNEAGKGNKIFDKSAHILTDMSSALGTDAKSSAIQLGKALNDPIKGMTALSRVGVTFTDKQKAVNTALIKGGTIEAINAMNGAVGTAALTSEKFAKFQKDNNLTYDETIKKLTGPMSDAQEKYFKHLEEGGHMAEAQKTILKELNSEFGGAAAAQATMGEKVSVAWGNIKEKIGTAILPLVDDIEKAFLKKGIPAAEKFAGWLQDKGIPAVQKFADWFEKKGIPAISNFARKAKPVINGLLTDARDILKEAEPYAKGFVKAFNNLPDGAKKGIGTAAILGLGAKKLGLLSGGQVLGGAKSLATKAVQMAMPKKPLPVIVMNPGFGAVGGGAGAAEGAAGGAAASRTGTVLKFAGKTSIYGLAFTGLSVAAMHVASKIINLQDKVDPSLKGTPLEGSPGAGSTGGGGGMTLPDHAIDFSEDNKKVNEFRGYVKNAKGEFIDFRKLLASPLKVLVNDAQITFATENSKAYRDTLKAVDKIDPLVTVKTMGLDGAQKSLDTYARKLAKLDGREARTYITQVYAKAGYQTKGGLQARAGGGPVAAHRPYLVGEREPELFVPNTSGRILNQRQMAQAGVSGGGGVTINVGEVRAHNYDDFMRQMQQRSVHAGGGGVVF